MGIPEAGERKERDKDRGGEGGEQKEIMARRFPPKMTYSRSSMNHK